MSRKHHSKVRLPILSHNTSSLKIQPQVKSDPLLSSHKKGIPSEKSLKQDKSFSFRHENPRSNSSMEEDFEKLDIISHRHLSMNNEYLNLQKRLIEMASSSKLRPIKETYPDSKFADRVDIMLQKYHENIRQKLKILENYSSNL
jgi:hypothetical protein